MKWTLFLDRDGVINKDLGYVHSFKDFEFLPGFINSLKRLSKFNIDIFIITNQSGIARGYFTEDDFNNFMFSLHKRLLNENILVKKTFYCPHHEDGVIKKYSIKCDCRKPKPGLINRAIDEFNIDKKKSIFIGDKLTDMAAAESAGIKHKILYKKKYAHNIEKTFVSYGSWIKIAEYIENNLFKA